MGMANMLSQYMQQLDEDDNTELLASRYYGNMAPIPDNADRHPKPMNSTLPLLSPSVIGGRISHRVHSLTESETARNRYQNESVDIHARSETPIAPKDLMAMSPKEPNKEPPTDDLQGEQAPCYPDKTAQEQVIQEHAESISPMQPLHETAALDTTSSATHSPLQRASIFGVPTSDLNEKADMLGVRVESRASSRARMRRTQNLGSTQYKPAASTKKNGLVRAAPGLSYMFTPTLSASRPSSVTGVPPSPSRAADVAISTHYSTPRMHAADVFGTANEPHFRDVPSSVEPAAHNKGGDGAVADQPGASGPQITSTRKTYGSINISALEQFLTSGEIPASSSEEEEDSTDAYSWEEGYQGSASESLLTQHSPNSNDGDKPQQQLEQQVPPQYRAPKPSAVNDRYAYQRQSITSSQPLPQMERTSYFSSTDERMPLLQRSATTSPRYAAENPRVFTPADLQPIGEPNFTGAYETQRQSDSMSAHKKRRHGRHRRPRRHHEELFLDKYGFIDESYRFTFFNPAVGTIRSQELADLRTPSMDLAALLQAGGCFWIDVLRPSFHEMHLMSKIFGIHALTVEDIMTQDVREKCEVHANYYFVCFKSFDSDPNSEAYLEPKCIYNIVMREGIITFHMDPSIHQYHVLRRIRRQIDHITVTPDWLNYAIIDDITDLVAPILQVIEFDVDSIDELVLVISSSEQSDMLLRISTARKRIMMVMRLLQGKADVVRALIKRFESATALSTSQMNAFAGNTSGVGYIADKQQQQQQQNIPQNARVADSPRYHIANGRPASTLPAEIPEAALEVALDQRKGQETLLYLGDVLDHIVTMSQNAAHYDNMLGRAHANYLAQISVELTESSNRTNDVVAKLSILAAIFLPLNLVAGIFGMNVKVPGQDDDSLYNIGIIVGCMASFSLLALTFCKWKRII
ncbi:CorA metal ion transporter [Dipsacomyces acuminosporus]|nr:CorA metal ion transporter [Dipsacomyces acuminosporus]